MPSVFGPGRSWTDEQKTPTNRDRRTEDAVGVHSLSLAIPLSARSTVGDLQRLWCWWPPGSEGTWPRGGLARDDDGGRGGGARRAPSALGVGVGVALVPLPRLASGFCPAGVVVVSESAFEGDLDRPLDHRGLANGPELAVAPGDAAIPEFTGSEIASRASTASSRRRPCLPTPGPAGGRHPCRASFEQCGRHRGPGSRAAGSHG